MSAGVKMQIGPTEVQDFHGVNDFDVLSLYPIAIYTSIYIYIPVWSK